jgi:hypothetical protein
MRRNIRAGSYMIVCCCCTNVALRKQCEKGLSLHSFAAIALIV